MKAILSYSIVAILMIGGVWFFYDQNFATTDYYTKIVSEGERIHVSAGEGRKQYLFKYHLQSYTKDGKEKDVSFNSFRNKPLEENAYLVLHVNKNKGVVGWEEIKSKYIPSSALNELDK